MTAKKEIVLKKTSILLVLVYGLVLGVSGLVGLIKGNEFNNVVFDIMSLITPVLILILYVREIINKKYLINTVLFGVICYSIFKILAVTLISINVISFIELRDAIFNIFSYEFISMLAVPEFNIIRIYIVNDLILIPSVIFILNNNHIKSNLLKGIIFILITLAMLISFSRYLIAIYVLVLLYVYIYKNIGLKNKAKVVRNMTYLFIASIIMLFMLNYFGLLDNLIERFSFSNTDNVSSDSTRDIQRESLLSIIDNNAISGAGLGSYDKNLIRNEYANSVYELQVLSLIAKLGIIMFISILSIVAYYVYTTIDKQYIPVVLILLLSGMFNPYLLTSVFGVCMLVTVLLSSTSKSKTASASEEIIVKEEGTNNLKC
ncbi:hypothetical protein OCB02_01745 [Bacillus cereus]|uniref:hypothetical protein n=3 Tax=Bacillus cereus TaxID=1396 RepID=UPI001243C96E|nr:hypothetical protein [Bacillus cereus]MCU5474466.1 hypothetical protein [Bacillus cereus]MCU5613722.1 hypothetical protein [Bacillus cereus]MDA2378795.1 hypothetical protein [Bacillus cereus]HDX9709104.1 hypothetical protein [Bacillus cereus]